MLIEIAENIDIFVNKKLAYTLNRGQDGVISFHDLNTRSQGTICFADRDVLEAFMHASNRLQRY